MWNFEQKLQLRLRGIKPNLSLDESFSRSNIDTYYFAFFEV